MLFRFRKFPVYLKAKEFRKLVKKLLIKFPSSEKYILVDQIERALNSICLNIAEGSNRSTDKDKALFFNRALTSLEEVISALDLSVDENYISSVAFENILKEAEELGKQLIAFYKYLKKS